MSCCPASAPPWGLCELDGNLTPDGDAGAVPRVKLKLPGLGGAGLAGYAAQTIALLKETLPRPDVAPVLSPIVGVSTSILTDAASAFLGATGPSDPGGVASSVLGVLGAGVETVKNVAATVGALADVVPVFQVWSAWFGVVEDDRAAKVAVALQNNRQNCLSQYEERQPKATGADGLLPCDLFADPGSTHPERDPYGWTNVGAVLVQWTEAGREDNYGGLPWPPSWSTVRKFFGSKVGVPPEKQALFRKLRRQIQAAYRRPDSDGGVSLWPLYLDLLRAEFDAGHLTPAFCTFLHVWRSADCGGCDNDKAQALGLIAAGKLPGDPQQLFPMDHCYRWDTRALRAALALVDNWTLKVRPIYAPERARLEALVTKLQKAAPAVIASRVGARFKNYSPAPKPATGRGQAPRPTSPRAPGPLHPSPAPRPPAVPPAGSGGWTSSALAIARARAASAAAPTTARTARASTGGAGKAAAGAALAALVLFL